MNIARYSLLTLQPDAERPDVLCIGLVVRSDTGGWDVLTPGLHKLQCLGATQAARRVPHMVANLLDLLQDADSLQEARALLHNLRSTLRLHGFEGAFGYHNDAEYAAQTRAIVGESVLPAQQAPHDKTTPTKAPRPRVKASLRRQFSHMGILAKKNAPRQPRMVHADYPISARHGLRAEFVIEHEHMFVTETVDFSVAPESHRNKTFEAQAKCLVMREALAVFGRDTSRLIVVRGGDAAHARSSVDLLSTAGDLFAVESDADMGRYFDIIAAAAGNPSQQLKAAHY